MVTSTKRQRQGLAAIANNPNVSPQAKAMMTANLRRQEKRRLNEMATAKAESLALEKENKSLRKKMADLVAKSTVDKEEDE